MGLASALGVLVRLDTIAARNRHLLPALATFRRYLNAFGTCIFLWVGVLDKIRTTIT